MTIHGSKSELKRLRYLKNHAKHVSMLPMAITFDPTIRFSISLVLWKLDNQSFPRRDQLNPSLGRPLNMCPKLDQEKAENANVSRVGWLAALQGVPKAKGPFF